MILFYSIFTSFIAETVKMNTDSMSPSLDKGDAFIFLPTNNLNRLLKRGFADYKRGEIVISSTNYSLDASFIYRVLDPIVRIFTLQKRSLLYDNMNTKGRAEILRIVGLPGDYIKIKDDTVYIKPGGEEFFLNEFELAKVDYDINKRELNRIWKDEFPFSSEHPEIYIPEDHYFLISDNRAYINDSRIFGPVENSKIIGSVFVKYWPLLEFNVY